MIGVPKYLSQYLSEKKQTGCTLSFKLKCICGCDVFSTVKNSCTPEEKRLQKEYEEKIPNTGWHTIYGGLDTNGKPYSYIKRFFFFKKHIVFPQEPVFMGIHVIKATCSQCKKEITVFDSRYHGYDSQFTSEEQKAYVPHFENSKERVGKITITMEQYAEEDVVPEHFSWIQIFVVNGDKRHTFFDAETG